MVETPNGTVVYVVNTSSNNVVESVPVAADVRDSIAVVYSGLKGDETVISGGSLKVKAGIPVKFELKNIELPEEFKQAYIEKYGQEPQQEEDQNQEGQQEENKEQSQDNQQQDNNNEQETQQAQEQATDNEQTK